MNKTTHSAFAKNIQTVYDAGQDRRDECASAMSHSREAQEKLNIERCTLSLYPEVGTLCRKGKSVFYAYIGGYDDSNYVESSDLDAVAGKVARGRIIRPIV